LEKFIVIVQLAIYIYSQMRKDLDQLVKMIDAEFWDRVAVRGVGLP